MKGEKDTYVNVSVKRDGKIKKFKIKRAEVSEPSVSGKMLENKIGYIELSTFVEKTPEDFNNRIHRIIYICRKNSRRLQ